MKHLTLVMLVLTAILCVIPAVGQQRVMYINLHGATPTVVVNGGIPYGVSPPTFTPVASPACPGTWWAAHVDIYLKDPSGAARTAHIVTEYDGTPAGWTVDIGDSATNNGYGGNDGGPEHAAEVQILNQTLSVYNDPKIPGQVDNMLNQPLSLTNGSLKFTVSNQTMTVGQPQTVLSTPVTQTLFWIPDPPALTDAERWSIHGAFNSVVNGDTGRQGCGVNNVAIWTTL